MSANSRAAKCSFLPPADAESAECNASEAGAELRRRCTGTSRAIASSPASLPSPIAPRPRRAFPRGRLGPRILRHTTGHYWAELGCRQYWTLTGAIRPVRGCGSAAVRVPLGRDGPNAGLGKVPGSLSELPNDCCCISEASFSAGSRTQARPSCQHFSMAVFHEADFWFGSAGVVADRWKE